ncbi:MAG: hypothetical protein R2856_05945 [Caldilineaceae bacterium]
MGDTEFESPRLLEWLQAPVGTSSFGNEQYQFINRPTVDEHQPI